jgi:hypothetical protein
LLQFPESTKRYLFLVEFFSPFRHHVGYDFLEHLNIAHGIEPEATNHLNFIVTGEEVFEVFDEDFEDFGFEVGEFLLS